MAPNSTYSAQCISTLSVSVSVSVSVSASVCGWLAHCLSVPVCVALNFSHAMDDPAVSDAAKVELLQTATNAHSAYLAKAAKAQGVDRVLLGWKQMLT